MYLDVRGINSLAAILSYIHLIYWLLLVANCRICPLLVTAKFKIDQYVCAVNTNTYLFSGKCLTVSLMVIM